LTKPSQKAAYVLMEVGIQPWEASASEIELAERMAKEFRYIEAAADEMRKILVLPSRT
jgi:hypothetical protein